MKEREIRQSIESFLKRTARELVVPASVGLGLALSGCERTAIQISPDATADVAQSAKPDGIVADTALAKESVVNRTDTASQPDSPLPDDARTALDALQADLPVLIIPYGVYIPRDAGADTRVDAASPDARVDTGRPDGDAEASDTESDSRTPDARPDARQADLPLVMPPYLGAPRPDAAQEMPAVMPPYMVPPPYMAPPVAPPQPIPDPPPAPEPPPPLPLDALQPPPPYLAPIFASVAPPAAVLPAKAPK